MASGSVLLIEDSHDVRDVIEEILSGYGFNVTLAADGRDAWEKINSGVFDLVVTDMGLPDTDGEELLKNMRHSSITTPVLITSGVDMKVSRTNWDDCTNYRLLLKPFNISEIKSAISDLLNKKIT